MKIDGDTLTLAMLEADWLLKLDKEKKLKTPHVQRENEVILTGTTEELRNFVSAIGTNHDAFPDNSVFVRKN
jgi:hypothetical protein